MLGWALDACRTVVACGLWTCRLVGLWGVDRIVLFVHQFVLLGKFVKTVTPFSPNSPVII